MFDKKGFKKYLDLRETSTRKSAQFFMAAHFFWRALYNQAGCLNEKACPHFLLDRLNPEYQINLWTNSWSTQFQQAHFLMSENHSPSYILDLQKNSKE
jgi:hypothetical protein